MALETVLEGQRKSFIYIYSGMGRGSNKKLFVFFFVSAFFALVSHSLDFGARCV